MAVVTITLFVAVCCRRRTSSSEPVDASAPSSSQSRAAPSAPPTSPDTSLRSPLTVQQTTYPESQDRWPVTLDHGKACLEHGSLTLILSSEPIDDCGSRELRKDRVTLTTRWGPGPDGRYFEGQVLDLGASAVAVTNLFGVTLRVRPRRVDVSAREVEATVEVTQRQHLESRADVRVPLQVVGGVAQGTQTREPKQGALVARIRGHEFRTGAVLGGVSRVGQEFTGTRTTRAIKELRLYRLPAIDCAHADDAFFVRIGGAGVLADISGNEGGRTLGGTLENHLILGQPQPAEFTAREYETSRTTGSRFFPNTIRLGEAESRRAIWHDVVDLQGARYEGRLLLEAAGTHVEGRVVAELCEMAIDERLGRPPLSSGHVVWRSFTSKHMAEPEAGVAGELDGASFRARSALAFPAAKSGAYVVRLYPVPRVPCHLRNDALFVEMRNAQSGKHDVTMTVAYPTLGASGRVESVYRGAPLAEARDGTAQLELARIDDTLAGTLRYTGKHGTLNGPLKVTLCSGGPPPGAE